MRDRESDRYELKLGIGTDLTFPFCRGVISVSRPSCPSNPSGRVPLRPRQLSRVKCRQTHVVSRLSTSRVSKTGLPGRSPKRKKRLEIGIRGSTQKSLCSHGGARGVRSDGSRRPTSTSVTAARSRTSRAADRLRLERTRRVTGRAWSSHILAGIVVRGIGHIVGILVRYNAM